jgi:hypothetical protein
MAIIQNNIYNFELEFELANWNFNNGEFLLNQEFLFKNTVNKVIETVIDINSYKGVGYIFKFTHVHLAERILIDMLMGAIYYGNQYATSFLLESYDFTKFSVDQEFMQMLKESIYQMGNISTQNAYITMDILDDYFF